MNDLFRTSEDIILRNDDNPFWELDKGDFPITLYDRPQLAFSNLLLRGDIDAATRAIFSPQSLTPAEMQTFSKRILQGRENPLLKTLVDISTNPIFIVGALLALKYPLGKADVLFRIGRGMGESAPGAIESLTHSAFTILARTKGAFKALADMTRATGDFLNDRGLALSKVFASGLSKDDQLLVWARLKGLHGEKGTKAFLDEWNSRAVRAGMKPFLPKGQVLFPRMQARVRPEIISTTQRLRNWATAHWEKMFPGEPMSHRTVKAELLTKGIELGDYREFYFPRHPRYNRLQAGALVKYIGGRKEYSGKVKGVVDTYISGNLRKVAGSSMGRWDQLQRLEELGMERGMVGWMQEVLKREGGHMREMIQSAWAQTVGIREPVVQADRFAVAVIDRLRKAGVDISNRLGNQIVAKGSLVKAAEELRAAGGTPRFTAMLDNIAATLTEPAHYDLRVLPAFSRYLTTTASTYAWHLKELPHPDIVGKTVHGFSSIIQPIVHGIQEGHIKSYVADELLPFMRGMKPWKSFIRSARFGQLKENMLTWMQTHPLPQKMLPPDTQKWLAKYYGDFSSLSSESIGAKIGEYFYLSTLGANISPTSKNLLQNFITLLHTPGVGFTGMYHGFRELIPRLARYKTLMLDPKTRGTAWETVFGDYDKYVGKASGMTKAMLKTGDIAREGYTLPGKAGTVWGKAKEAMMFPFGTSEAFNRLLGFYAGKQGYLHTATRAAGVTAKQFAAEAGEFGANMIHVGHFMGGPIGMPRALLGVWGPSRQFMHFPLRYLGFLTSSMRWGEGPGRFTTVGRVGAASAAAYIGAKNLLGADISQGLMYGALPFPQYEKSAFYPWPLVPPIFQIAGSGVQALGTGEAQPAVRSLALLAPSGIAARRLYKTLGKKYADYANRTQDGRIPVYNDQNALIGAFSPWQLSLRALGISPSSQQAEYGAAKWLLTQRNKIRTFRRDYLEALSENNVVRAMKINEDFQKAYPELGPIQLKKSDITAVQNRREISRLNRILKGFPKAYQPLFEHMISQASLSRMTENLERRPSGLETYMPLVSQLR